MQDIVLKFGFGLSQWKRCFHSSLDWEGKSLIYQRAPLSIWLVEVRMWWTVVNRRFKQSPAEYFLNTPALLQTASSVTLPDGPVKQTIWHVRSNSGRIKSECPEVKSSQVQRHPARLVGVSDSIQYAGKFSQAGKITDEILHSKHLRRRCEWFHSTKLPAYNMTQQVRIVEVPFQGDELSDPSSMEAKRVTSSWFNLIMSAVYFLIHLPHGETASLLGDAFVVNPLGTILWRRVQCLKTGDLIWFERIATEDVSHHVQSS